MTTLTRRLLLAPCLATTLSCSDPVAAQDPPQGFEGCSSPRGTAWCGVLEVPEDHGEPGGRTIGLAVKVLAAPDGGTGAPVYFLAGGPGQAVADLEGLLVQRFGARLPDRDFVLVDQRGTGGSNPLTCRSGAPADPTRFFGPHYTDDELAACLDELGTRADVRLYTTLDFAHDLEAVRRQLGHGPIDVVGGSYGTKAAQVFVRAYPESVGVLVMEGVASTSFLNPLPAARGSQDALDALFATCDRDAGCSRAFPDLDERFPALMARLADAPPAVRVPGTSVDVPLEPEALAYITHLLLFNTQSSVLLPALIDQVERGEHQLLTAFYQQIVDALVQGIHFGLQMTVTCTENAPYFATRDLDAETAGTYLGRTMVDGVLEQCERWPRGTIPPGFHDPVTVDLPALLVSGGVDPATPRRFADQVAASLPRATHLTIPDGAHITPHPCVDQLVADFIASRGEALLDTACLRGIRRPAFQGLPPG